MNKEDIEQWLNDQKIQNYVINDNLIVDVNGNVMLTKICTEIPIQFGTVHGNFHCSYNHLTCLFGCPSSVIGDFVVFNNNLNTVEGIPKHITGDCFLQYNPLENLKKISDTIIDGNLFLNNTNITYFDPSQLPKAVGKKIFLSNQDSPIENFELFTIQKRNKNDTLQYELITSIDEINSVFQRIREYDELKQLPINNKYKKMPKQKI